MKPFKAGTGLSSWLLRLSLIAIIVNIYLELFIHFNLSSINFYFAAAYIFLGGLLFVGGLIPKHTLTVVSGLFIFLLAIYKTVVHFKEGFGSALIIHFTILAIGFYFFSNGNKTG